jgi:predicted PurR-regulated permease PerM
MTKKNDLDLPFLLRFALLLISLVGLVFIMYVGKAILIPLIFALLFAMLLNPAVDFMARHKINRILAIAVMLVVSMAAFAGVIYFISSQAAMFKESFPAMQDKFTSIYQDALQWASQKFSLEESEITAWIQDSKQKMMDGSGSMIGQVFVSVGGLLAVVFLLPVYIFMILYYKPLFLEFIARLFDDSRKPMVSEILKDTKLLVQNYLIGLIIEAVIMAAMDTSVLLILGIKYALLLGVLAAILNLIPYIGGIVAISLPMFIAAATKPPVYILWVFIGYMIVQFIDNNVVMPKVVGSRVKINALAAVVAVLVGGAIWGVPGMFLSLPIMAIIKIIFDRIEPLEPWGFLLGDNMPTVGSSLFKSRSARKKPK